MGEEEFRSEIGSEKKMDMDTHGEVFKMRAEKELKNKGLMETGIL